MSGVIDWDLAQSIGTRMVRSGPNVSREAADECVAGLAAAASAARGPVAAVSELTADPVTHKTQVVDRKDWIASNIATFRLIVSPLEDRIAAKNGTEAAKILAGKTSATEIGAILSWVATKVLGQFEALVPPGQAPRLLLVAPNIMDAEQTMGVDSADFRSWVCLHEETHRVQFGANPWLTDYFQGEINTFLAASPMSATETIRRLAGVIRAIGRVLRGGSGTALVEAVQTPTQRDVYDRLTAFLSLLEGHADYIMDAAGPGVIPSLPSIRAKFDERRNNPKVMDGLLRRLLGMDAKLRQYTDGRKFVEAVVADRGISGFNVVWTDQTTLPTRAEIADPALWLARN